MSIELECVFFSLTPIVGKKSISTFALISSSRASSFNRTCLESDIRSSKFSLLLRAFGLLGAFVHGCGRCAIRFRRFFLFGRFFRSGLCFACIAARHSSRLGVHLGMGLGWFLDNQTFGGCFVLGGRFARGR